MSEWEKIDTAPKDGTIIRFYRGNGNAPESVYWGRFHPNSPGKDCWRLNYTNQPIQYISDSAMWKPIEEVTTKKVHWTV